MNSAEDAYKQIEEALNFLSKKGESIVLHPSRGGNPQLISGFSGGVVWSLAYGRWESYLEG